MAPTKIKTWQYIVNQDLNALADYATTRKFLLWTIKQNLKAFALNAWTVSYSCDGTTAGAAGDGIDRWVASTNLVFANKTAAHSWIVLKQPALGTNVELLLSCNTDNLGAVPTRIVAQLAVGGTGFSGGSTTADPTAPEVVSTLLQSTVAGLTAGCGYWCMGDDQTTNFNCALHSLMSSDGECTRVGVFVGAIPMLYLAIEKVNNPATGLTVPIFSTWLGDYMSGLSQVNDSPLWYFYMADLSPYYPSTPEWRAGVMHHTSDFNVHFFTERTGMNNVDTALAQRSCKYNTLDGSKKALTGIGIYSKAAGKSGRHGAIYDLWFGDDWEPVGRGYPTDSTAQFVHWRHLVMPWNGTTMLVA